MVQTGVQRAFGHVLKAWLRGALRNQMTAALSGALLAMALQSATAVAVVVTGFVGSGLVPVARGIAALLGADLGSALVALILQLDLSMLMPVLLLAGVLIFRNAGDRKWQQIGRVLIGIGLVLLSLRLIGMAAQPLRDSAALPHVFNYLRTDWITVFLLAGLMAFALHSSIASVLVVATMAQQGLIPPALILPIVLGINCGAALIPVYLTRSMAHPAQLVPLGNLVMRGGGAAVALVIVLLLRPDLMALLPENTGEGAATVLVHVAFNTVLMVSGFALSGVLSRALGALLRPAPVASSLYGERCSALNENDLSMPSVALANASRELMVICERVEMMMARIPDLYHDPEVAGIDALSGLDDEIDELHTRIKLYLARIPDDMLDQNELARANDILGATIKLEQIADIITRNLAKKAKKKAERGVEFSREGWEELQAIHEVVHDNTRLAFSVLLSDDVELARSLASSKEKLRELEHASESCHLQRLRAGNAQSRETSALHVDMIRDLKEINSLLVSLTYPVLERAGMLRTSRLV
jgi:phosphate:Na+ symporter